MAKVKIEHNKDMCIGCGACAAACDNWEMGDDGKAHPKKTELDEVGCNQEAADNCPVSCITVVEE
ncbi:ferredoxin [Candidatus Woesearchaeota archaeon]|jgi:ferredoxin|nr:ferredoxin [Candidatus Woesearchaeota archaeon]MBT6518894.1 ferredoxin [Candidatus Woesearchaeota archaeon]MBT7368496.1 ferredoxin [Candidatus Woesearchaeota archaeon]